MLLFFGGLSLGSPPRPDQPKQKNRVIERGKEKKPRRVEKKKTRKTNKTNKKQNPNQTPIQYTHCVSPNLFLLPHPQHGLLPNRKTRGVTVTVSDGPLEQARAPPCRVRTLVSSRRLRSEWSEGESEKWWLVVGGGDGRTGDGDGGVWELGLTHGGGFCDTTKC